MTMRIGYFYKNYPEIRCIVNKTENIYVHSNSKKSFSHLMKSILWRLKLVDGWDFTATVTDLRREDVDIYHTFNAIVKTNKPYVITFESAIPRTRDTIDRRWEWDSLWTERISKKTRYYTYQLLHKNCIRLLALSNNTKDVMRYQLEAMKLSDDVVENIMKKVQVVYPPQAVNCTKKEIFSKYKVSSRPLRLIFVGNDFYSKGGAILINTLKGYDKKLFHLTIISAFRPDSTYGYSEKEQLELREYCNNQSWISVLQNIPNEDVLKLVKESDIGFLPTIQETFGYSVLEMQASGCPVVTTDVRALGETNDNLRGWQISVKKHPISREAFYHDHNELKKLQVDIENALDIVLSEILEKWTHGDMDYFIDKAEEALLSIQRNNDPVIYGRTVEKIYKEAMLH